MSNFIDGQMRQAWSWTAHAVANDIDLARQMADEPPSRQTTKFETFEFGPVAQLLAALLRQNSNNTMDPIVPRTARDTLDEEHRELIRTQTTAGVLRVSGDEYERLVAEATSAGAVAQFDDAPDNTNGWSIS